ncbi:type I restriction enzyme HsdR N-terminal domain-containing protein [Flavobacterium silvaticum]|uniref:Type I restriction enzyme HsdR N-terminal domain-containing protein n=1 Tax=Flavobacterium silvaticum TaxID=1852020 RepID=A0A972JKF8_9FLAO|nr:type I restriction enzyme HsdR N-terminal domain-containing protein [Flavobacterium silvaticum]NMH29097.1 type I restriction enzyme HsdR N-terminal domain-containing protein [Flavobacterium silvaticum]
MRELSFPAYQFRYKKDNGQTLIFCETRKKFVVLTPEEWVRQHTVKFLLNELNYPTGLLNVERLINLNGLSKRYDIVIYNTDGSVFLLVECKAPEVMVGQHVFDQIARYNLSMKADYLMVTNGLSHYFCKLDYTNGRYNFLRSLPSYPKPKSI